MDRKRRLLSFFFLFCLMLNVSRVQAADDHPGVKIGEKAPDFTLKDQSGKEQTLSKLTSEKPVAVVFHRSADW